MAKRRTDEQMMIEQQAQADAQMQALDEINAMNEQAAIMQQETNNKSHDTEFTQYSDATEDGIGTLGVIGKDEIAEAYQILLKYREAKATLEQKLEDNEEFWKMNHWSVMYRNENKSEDDKRIKPKSAWLFNTIINKHADAMDNFPEPNVLPRTRDDEETAKTLAEIIPVIMEQNNYEQTYSDAQWYKCKNGTSVQGIFWNNDKSNGLGDIDIKKIDLMNLYWKSGISDIQDSPNLFHVTMMDNEEIKLRYPQLEHIGNGGNTQLGNNEFVRYGEVVDTSEMSAVIDWYYKKRVKGADEMGIPQVKTVLHYCKFVNDEVIYASENDPNFTERGWYDHGKYPFVFDTLFPIEGSVCGIGYIDIVKDDQLYIDKLQQAILENAVVNSRPRYAVRNDSNLNEEEFMDISNPVVHFDGNLGEDAFRQIVASPLNGIYETVYESKVSELKETSGNTAASQGQTSSVTSASGIASLQEAAGKLSRDSNTTSYRAYKEVVDMVIELIRQFYDAPRCFRITGDRGEYEYRTFDNGGLQPQPQGTDFGIDLGNRLPTMDIDVKPQKKSAYSKESQNQTALNMYSMGFFAPNNADAALACLDMMDFDGIEKMREKVSQNATLMQMVMMLQQQLMEMSSIVDGQNGSNLTEGIMAQMQGLGMGGQATGSAPQESKGSLSSQAANATRGSTAPR